MAFNVQLPGSFNFQKIDFPSTQYPSTGGFSSSTASCYSYIEKMSSLVNPASLQHDVLYGNTFAATLEHSEGTNNGEPCLLGCVGHRIDKEFPLEATTPICLPLVMNVNKESGNVLDHVDMCARPVLNWEEYIKQLKQPLCPILKRHVRKRVNQSSDNQESQGTERNVSIQELERDLGISLSDKTRGLSSVALTNLYNQPTFRVEGTWNHLYGGNSGACCFSMCKSSSRMRIFVGKGRNLRLIEFKKADPASLFPYQVEYTLDEDFPGEAIFKGDILDHFDEIILQIVPDDTNGLLGTRRGRSIQIYDISEEAAIFLESIPNKYYGTRNYDVRRTRSVDNPLLCGFDFNRSFSPEIITIDENHVVRVCNMCERSTVTEFSLPDTRPVRNIPQGYPHFQVNDAAGVEFLTKTNGNLFLAWGNSTVYLGDRRSSKYSREHINPIFNLRTHAYNIATSSQRHFHEFSTRLNEYMSCVKRSNREMLYYVGTSSRIFLMDLRVPNHPVISANHHLQSPPVYINVQKDPNEIFETVVGSSQRLTETFSLVSDSVHLECSQNPGCKARYPLLQSYPRHLLNSRNAYASIVGEGYDFPLPVDNHLVESHFNAWTTGIATLPLPTKGDTDVPGGIVLVTSNHFGEIYAQEWRPRPLPSHKRAKLSDPKFETYLKSWHSKTTKHLQHDSKKMPENRNGAEDCTVLVEPLVQEIERLLNVRNKPFDCFTPDPVIYSRAISNAQSVNTFCDKMESFGSIIVKDILNTWRSDDATDAFHETITIPEVKAEPAAFPCLSPSGTVDIDADEDEMALQHPLSDTEIGGYGTIEDSAMNEVDENEWMDYIGSNNDDQMYPSIQEQQAPPEPSTSRTRKSSQNVRKTRKSGFQ